MVCSACVIRSRSSLRDMANGGTWTLSLTNAQRKKSHGVRSGERSGQGKRWLSPFAARPIQRCWRTRLRSTRTFLWKLGEHRPVVECNRHNWCSFRVTTSFPHHYFLHTLYIQQDESYTVYFVWKLLYMFRVVPPPSIRSANNYIYSICHLSHRYRHPQHTQTSSNSSTIAADSSNGVTNNRCCRYSCLRSWWWVVVPTETCRAVSR